MALIPTQNRPTGTAGETAFTAASASGDTFVYNGTEKVLFKNDNASSRTITLTAVGACSHGFLHNLQVVVPANKAYDLSGFSKDRFAAVGTHIVSMTYSAHADLFIAVLGG